VAEGPRMTLAFLGTFGDAIKFIFHSRESVGGGAQIGGSHLLPLLGKHLEVTGEAMGIACVLGILPALWIGHLGRGQLLASTVANAGRALPSYAVVVFTSSFAIFGLSTRNLVFAMVLLAIPPIFTNTYVGVRQVDPDAVDAARGMGLTGRQIVTQVELPLALPLVFGGIRTSTVNVVATATLGPLVGVLTLGDPIVNANVYGDAGRLGGAILVAGLALSFEFLFAGLQRAVTPRGLKSPPTRRTMSPLRSRPAIATLLAAGAALVLAACGGGNDNKKASSNSSTTGGSSSKVIQPVQGASSTPTITVGSKNFTEEFILGEIYAQSLQAAGYKVKKQLNLGSEQIAYKALKAAKIDAYPEYTGTALTSFYGVKITAVPKDEQAAYELTKQKAANDHITPLAPTPFTDSNGFAMTQQRADQLGVKSISDLSGKSTKLRLAGPPECRQRPDCALGLKNVYHLAFKSFTTVDLAKRHEVLKNGQADVSLVFTTDGQIKADNLALLADDKQMFPPYNASFLVRDSTLQSHPGMDKVIDQVNQGLTTPVMQELNSRVDLDKQKPAAVAKEYLTESGYLK
jgi:glycine betaine/choline ABC-type transport system substrate-binding protein/ABC-type proline/glycine betaine transport system permease subunit